MQAFVVTGKCSLLDPFSFPFWEWRASTAKLAGADLRGSRRRAITFVLGGFVAIFVIALLAFLVYKTPVDRER